MSIIDSSVKITKSLVVDDFVTVHDLTVSNSLEVKGETNLMNVHSNNLVSNAIIGNELKSNGVILAGGDIYSQTNIKADWVASSAIVKTNAIRKMVNLELITKDTLITAKLIAGDRMTQGSKLLIPPYTGSITLYLDTAKNYNDQFKLWDSDFLTGGEMYEINITNSILNNDNVYVKNTFDDTSVNMMHVGNIIIKPGKTRVLYLRCDGYHGRYHLF